MGPRKVRDFTAKKKEKKTENDKEKTIRVNNQIHIYIYIYIYPHEEISWLARVYRNYSPYVRRLFQRKKELR